MPIEYDKDIASIVIEDNGRTLVSHIHCNSIDYRQYTKDNMKRVIDADVPRIKCCIKFFKAYQDKSDDPKVVATCAQAIAEDEVRLERHKRMRNSSPCLIM